MEGLRKLDIPEVQLISRSSLFSPDSQMILKLARQIGSRTEACNVTNHTNSNYIAPEEGAIGQIGMCVSYPILARVTNSVSE